MKCRSLILLLVFFVLILFSGILLRPCIAQESTDNEQTEIQVPETDYIQGKIIEILEETRSN